VVTCLFVAGVTRCPAAEPNPAAMPANGEDVEPLLRGPLHEAFAEPIQLNPQPAPVVPKQPPEPIEELAAEAKPAEENVIWIPGYWAWDEEREDFIYISGVWRVAPEGRRWVPGYWTQVDGGYQWVSGFWAPIAAEEIQYLPYPPESLESGPSSPAPSTEHYWVSGNWCYQNDRFAWRPGYWNTFREDWVWVPAHYVWTPGGAVFIDGYWDCPFRRRGVVFAPVWFSRPAYLRRGYCYTPSVVIDIPHLLVHLFVYPRRCHYYWGDYYDYYPYRSRHFYTCYDYHGRHGYDPVFAYYDAYHRHRHIDYTQRLRGWHDYFHHHKEFRPPHTLHAQTQLAARAKHNADLQYALLGNRLDDVLSGRGGPAHFERISQTHQQSWNDAISQTRELTRRRLDVETHPKHFDPDARGPSLTRGDGPARLGGPVDAPRPPVKLKLPELPRVAGYQAKTAPERLDKPRTFDRAEVPKIERGTPVPDRIGSDLGMLRDTAKLRERSPTHPATRSLPDVSKLRQPDVTSSRNTTPKIEIPRTPEFRKPELGSVRQSPSDRNLTEGGPSTSSPRTVPTADRSPSFKLPDRGPSLKTVPTPDRSPSFQLPDRGTSLKTVPTPDRTPSFQLPDRGPSLKTVPTPDRTPSFQLPDRSPSVRTVPTPDRTLTFKVPDRGPPPRIQTPRIEAPAAARQEVRPPQVTIPKLRSFTPPPSQSLRSNFQGPSSVSRPRLELPNNSARVVGPRLETPSRQAPRPEFRSRDVPQPRSDPPRIDTNRHGPERTPNSGRHKR
ncbi:MAG TPA: hypothetical protein PLF81_17555, partial [Candidatus Anammoximicrobium sp.]|nr:hypothetical protein [Candidatus Anammoximicrobium sp.]